LRRSAGRIDGVPVQGYEIHHGRVIANGEAALLCDADGVPEGSVRGSIVGTHWHGLLENDAYRRSFLADVARWSGRDFVAASDTSVAAVRASQLDLLADLVEHHVDVDAVCRLIEHGVPPLPPVADLLA